MTTLFLALALMASAAQGPPTDTTQLSRIDISDAASVTGDIDVGHWTLESSLTFPMVRIYLVKASYRISEAAEPGIGLAFQNWKNVDEAPLGQSNAMTLLLAYRHYFWRGLHAELELWPAYNRFESFVDSRIHSGFELWIEYRIGYTIPMTSRLNLLLQPGLGHALWMQNPWPDLSHESFGEFVSETLIFVPQVLVGWRF